MTSRVKSPNLPSKLNFSTVLIHSNIGKSTKPLPLYFSTFKRSVPYVAGSEHSEQESDMHCTRAGRHLSVYPLLLPL